MSKEKGAAGERTCINCRDEDGVSLSFFLSWDWDWDLGDRDAMRCDAMRGTSLSETGGGSLGRAKERKEMGE